MPPHVTDDTGSHLGQPPLDVPSAAGRFSCARTSFADGESLRGTASTVRRWVLLEQPGAWGAEALPQSGLGPDLARRLCDHVEAAGARLVLIRRTGGGQVAAGRRTYVAHCDAVEPWAERLTVRDPAELLDHDLAPLRRGASVGGRRVRQPLYLVCTNGKKDPCCAEFGLPVARALAGVFGERVWESSHIGGDRFAGNLVALPHGVYYGHVTPDSAKAMIAAHEAGLIHLDGYRGRTIHPFVVQAADDLVRRRLDLTGLDDLAHVATDAHGATTTVDFDDRASRRVRAVVRVDRTRTRRLTCHAARPDRPPVYTLESLTVDGLATG